MTLSSIYYGFSLPPVTGGDFVCLDHVAGLRQQGLDARIFYGASDDGYTKFPVTLPVARLGTPLRPGDVMVLGENHAFDRLRGIDCIKVMHNQNPYLTFQGFESIAALNAYPLAHILVPSDFCAARLLEMGVTKPISRVRPALPGYFAPTDKQLVIAYAPGKRPIEADFLKGSFRSAVPAYADVPWIPLSGLTRAACAQVMAGAAVYAAFPLLEGLGLMSLEAMASGCQVVGYTGHGGSEYATEQNGDWIAEGDHAAFVQGLHVACGLFRSGVNNPRIAAGRAAAAQFSAANFQVELARAWTAILGERAGLYRL